MHVRIMVNHKLIFEKYQIFVFLLGRENMPKYKNILLRFRFKTCIVVYERKKSARFARKYERA